MVSRIHIVSSSLSLSVSWMFSFSHWKNQKNKGTLLSPLFLSLLLVSENWLLFLIQSFNLSFVLITDFGIFLKMIPCFALFCWKPIRKICLLGIGSLVFSFFFLSVFSFHQCFYLHHCCMIGLDISLLANSTFGAQYYYLIIKIQSSVLNQFFKTPPNLELHVQRLHLCFIWSLCYLERITD